MKIKSIIINANLHKRLKERADLLGMKFSAFIERILEKALTNDEQK